MDFTLKAYEKILIAIKEADLPVYTISQWIEAPRDRGVILRHDVDRLPKNALEMARLEASYGVFATYYFRIGRHTFKPEIISAIANLGHEIGYHYEDLSLAKGNKKIAFTLFEKHLTMLRKYANIRTIAMHGRPLSGFDNRELWKERDFRDFDLIGEAFLSIDYSDLYYFTDTGRSWSEHSINLRDKVQLSKAANINSTYELGNFIKSSRKSKISIVAHPERWNKLMVKWLGYLVFDKFVNILKHFLKIVHR